VTQFDVRLDENDRAVTAVELRPANDDNYKQLIDDYSPKLGREDECSKTKYLEGGRLSGSIGGSAMAGFSASYLTCNILLGVESAGSSLLWCRLIAGGVGTYKGGEYGASMGESRGKLLYEVIKDD